MENGNVPPPAFIHGRRKLHDFNHSCMLYYDHKKPSCFHYESYIWECIYRAIKLSECSTGSTLRHYHAIAYS